MSGRERERERERRERDRQTEKLLKELFLLYYPKAYKMSLTTEAHVWMFPAWYHPDWYKVDYRDPNNGSVICSKEEVYIHCSCIYFSCTLQGFIQCVGGWGGKASPPPPEMEREKRRGKGEREREGGSMYVSPFIGAAI